MSFIVVLATGDGMGDHDANKCTFGVRIDASFEDDALHAPSFRFRFLDGSKKQTPTVGATGWSAVPEEPGSWRFEASFADVLVNEALASAIDDDPVVTFVLSDQATTSPASTGASAKGTDTKGKPPTASSTTTAPVVDHTTPRMTSKAATFGRGRLVADLFEVDTSSLLGGETLQIEHTWIGSSSTTDVHTLSDDDDDEAAGSSSIFTRLANAKALQQCSRSIFVPTSGIRSVTIHITVDKPLLSPALRAKLNPLKLILRTARRLPGIGSARPGNKVSEDPHIALARRCRPVYALWRFYPERQLYQAQRTRLVITHGRDHSETVEWHQATTVLTGRCHAQELYDALHASSLTVEIHDRDLILDDGPLLKLHSKWESLHTTGVDPTVTAPPHNAGNISSRTTTPRATATAVHKPMDAFTVDEIAKHDWRALVARAGEQFAYGAATFRLNELLDKAKVLTASDPHKPYMSLKLTADVLARKRRAQPIDAAALAESDGGLGCQQIDMTPIDKQTREPGAYVENSTTLSLQVTLQHPLVIASTQVPLYSRLVVLFPYKDSRMLQQVMRAIEAVNLRALSDGISIRSYQMTPQEKHACATGTLDVITGCMIIDDDLRTIIVEGLADGGMAQVYAALPRTQPQSATFRMFANSELRFTTRLYTAFEVDLKRIKLRYALPTLLKTPDIYMRTKVTEPCYVALTTLMELRRVSRLAEVKELDLFPSAATLLEVESKYGESISLEDIYGKRKTGGSVAGKLGTKETRDNPATDPADGEEEEEEADDDDDERERRKQRDHHTPKRTHLKAPTDATNPSFDQHLRTREPKDFVEARKKLSEEQRSVYEHKKQQELEQRGPTTDVVYMYSGQKFRTQDALQEELRKKLSSDTRATFTYGPEFQSLTMSIVNPDELRQTEERVAKKKWTTQRGFVYPVPRPTAEYYKHPSAPSEARCEDLHMPFIDNMNHPKPASRDNNRGGDSRTEFSTLPSKDMIFGGTNGDGGANSEYFKSVHLCGEGLRQEMEEALEKERQEWERKLVVDKKQINFLAHGNICSQPSSTRRHASQLDKLRDILNGPARSKPLRIVRHATLPSGKLVPLHPPPASIVTLQEYDGPVAATFANTLRHNDKGTPLLATDPTTGKPKDFHFPSVTDLMTPPVKRNVTHKEIRPVATQEKKGFLWSNSVQ